MKFITPCLILTATITASTHAQCYTCALPNAINGNIVTDFCQTLGVSSLQRSEIERLHDCYLDNWHHLQDTNVAELASTNEQGLLHAKEVSECASHIIRMWQRMRVIEDDLQHIDSQFFAQVADTLTEEQSFLLKVWKYDQQSRWYAMGLNGSISVASPLATIPSTSESLSRRQAAIAAIGQIVHERADQLKSISLETRRDMLTLIESIRNGDFGLPELIAKLKHLGEAQAARVHAVDAVAFRDAVGQHDGLAAEQMTMRMAINDGQWVDDIATRQLLLWSERIRQCDFSPAVEAAARAVLADLYTQVQSEAASFDATTSHEISLRISTIIGRLSQQLQHAIGPDAYHAVMTVRLESPHPRPIHNATTRISESLAAMTPEKFGDICEILHLDPNGFAERLILEKAVHTHRIDAEIIAAQRNAAEPLTEIPSPAEAASWITTQQAARNKADAIDAGLIANAAAIVGQDSSGPRIRLANQLAMAWRREIPFATASSQAWTSHAHQISITEAVIGCGSDLLGPSQINVLLEHTSALLPLLEEAALARWKREAYASASSDMNIQVDAAEQRVAVARTVAREILAESLSTKDLARWKAHFTRLAWPQVAHPLDQARKRLQQQLADPNLNDQERKTMRTAFTNIVMKATALQDRMLTMLQSISTKTGSRLPMDMSVRLASLQAQQLAVIGN